MRQMAKWKINCQRDAAAAKLYPRSAVNAEIESRSEHADVQPSRPVAQIIILPWLWPTSMITRFRVQARGARPLRRERWSQPLKWVKIRKAEPGSRWDR